MILCESNAAGFCANQTDCTNRNGAVAGHGSRTLMGEKSHTRLPSGGYAQAPAS